VKQNSSPRASALHITLRATPISLSTALLALAAVTPARNQFERKPAGAGVTLQPAHTCAAVSEPSAALKRIRANRQRVGGHDISGFSARQAHTAQAENLIPPAGLKPVEQEAWLRHGTAAGGNRRHRRRLPDSPQMYSALPASDQFARILSTS